MFTSACSATFIAQPSLFGTGEPSFDAAFGGIARRRLGRGAWIDYQPGWLGGHQTVFDRLVDVVEWEQHRRPMYERMVDVPRLTGSLPSSDETPDRAGDGGLATDRGLAVMTEMAEALSHRYQCHFERIGIALYRHGGDSVAWHGDRVARERQQALVATVSVGEPRKFCLRPKNGGPSQSLRLGHGDLLVMGGTCQRTWDHAVPKVARAGPRIAIMFRPVWLV